MNSTDRIATCLAAILVVASSLLATAQTSKPVVEGSVWLEIEPPPETVEQMTEASEAVVVAQYRGQRHFVHEKAGGGRVRTVFRLHIAETLKYSPYLHDDFVDIEMRGGDTDMGDHIRRERLVGFVEFRVGQRYLLFLRLDLATNQLYLGWYSAGAFDVTGSRVTPLNSELKRHDGTDVGAFISSVRAAARRRTPPPTPTRPQ